MPLTSAEPVPTKLYTRITEAMPDMSIVTMDRKHFNDAQGLDAIRLYGLDDLSTITPGLEKK